MTIKLSTGALRSTAIVMHSPDYPMEIGSESEIYSLSAIDKDFPITAMDIRKVTL